MTQPEIEREVEDRILRCDVDLLNDLNVSDDVMKIMAAEHAARSMTLAKAIEPTLGRAFLLIAAGALLSAADTIAKNSFQEPEVVHVGA